MGKKVTGTPREDAEKEHREANLPSTKTETQFGVPVQEQALARLSRQEFHRYRRALTVLATGAEVRGLLQANMALTGRGIYEACLAQSWAIRFDDPEAMIRLARGAVEVSQRGIPEDRIGETADLQARAWGELANAYRTADRLRSAQLAFGEAYTLLQKGTGDPYLKARLFDLEASLLGTLRDFPLALRRLAGLFNLYQDLGEIHLSGRALIIQALYTYYSGNTREALSLNEKATSLINQDVDPALFLLAVHNHILFLTDLKLYPKARRILFENRRSLIYKDRVNALRLRGLEGRIDYGMGNLLSAEAALREAKDGIAQTGMMFLVALLAIELAMVLRSQNKIEEALQEIVEAREIFLAVEIYREFLGSVIFLEESLKLGEAAPELIEATFALIYRKWLLIRPQQMQ